VAKKKRLSGPAAVATGPATKYTTPALIRTVVRHIHVSNPSASSVDFTLSIGADAAGTRLFDAYPIAADTVLDHFCYYILEPADIIAAGAGTNNILVMTIDGDEDVA
jgi:hypothetical protein